MGQRTWKRGDYDDALGEILHLLGNEQLLGIGHRVVHGGEFFKTSVKIDDDVLSNIKECNHLAPLHNPAAALGIEIMGKGISHDLPSCRL